jgi:diacylglycerol kinase (ATP)
MESSRRQIQVIINPAAGKDAPILNTLNRVFGKHDVCWQAAVTHEAGDATRLAQEAVANGVDLVVGYGGDGTLMEIVNGLVGSDTPLAILPGGTGNGIAKELGVPTNLEHAADLICGDPKIRQIDLGLLDGRYFLLHAYVGMKSSQRASRELKDRFGILAYALTILQVIADPQVSHYSLTVDGREIKQDGIVCMILNAAGLGIDLPVVADINPQNGLLNLFVVKKDALSVVANPTNLHDLGNLIESWQGREISLQAEPSQTVWIDGEEAKETPCTIKIVPKALRVLVA